MRHCDVHVMTVRLRLPRHAPVYVCLTTVRDCGPCLRSSPVRLVPTYSIQQQWESMSGERTRLTCFIILWLVHCRPSCAVFVRLVISCLFVTANVQLYLCRCPQQPEGEQPPSEGGGPPSVVCSAVCCFTLPPATDGCTSRPAGQPPGGTTLPISRHPLLASEACRTTLVPDTYVYMWRR